MTISEKYLEERVEQMEGWLVDHVDANKYREHAIKIIKLK